MAQIWKNETSNWSFRNIERKRFFNVVKNQEGNILEIGPGYGRLMLRLIKIGKEVIGLEMSENLVNKIKEKGLEVIKGNACDIPFEKNKFSCVCMEEVIEHIKEQDIALKEIYRVLKPGGSLIISTPNKWIYRFFMYISNIISLQFSLDLLRNPTPDHVTELTLKSIKMKFKKFNNISVMPINNYLPSFLLKGLPNLAIGFIIVGKK